jgi:hypothetical protein
MELLRQLVKQLDTFAETWKNTSDKNIVGCEKNVRLLFHIYIVAKKQVSVGTWRKDSKKNRIVHTAPTCPGSSGAYIF